MWNSATWRGAHACRAGAGGVCGAWRARVPGTTETAWALSLHGRRLDHRAERHTHRACHRHAWVTTWY